MRKKTLFLVLLYSVALALPAGAKRLNSPFKEALIPLIPIT